MYQEKLLTKRIPRADIIFGRAYIIHARNGGVGIAVKTNIPSGSVYKNNAWIENQEQINYTLHRVKFGNHFLDNEVDWEDCDRHGTAIPLRLLPDIPPEDKETWLDWLAALELEHKEEIAATWQQ